MFPQSLRTSTWAKRFCPWENCNYERIVDSGLFMQVLPFRRSSAKFL